MLQSKTIARPYAVAIFNLAKQGKSISTWKEYLQKLSLVMQNEYMSSLLGNPKVNQVTLLSAIKDAAGISSKELNALLDLLLQNKRLAYIPHINTYFNALVTTDSGQKDVVIESAFPVTPEQQKILVKQLELIFKHKLNVSIKIVPELIGGIRAIVGDQVYDYSLKAHLAKIKTNIMHI